MATVARLTGLAPVLLRAWERRHRLLEPERLPGGHRLYTDDDLAVLARVQALLADGRSIGEVAALGRPALLAQAPAARPAAAAGAVLPAELVAGLLAAAQALDEEGLDRALDGAFGALSYDAVVAEVLVPALRRVGDLWSTGEASVASEHLLSARVVQRLRGVLDAGRPRAGRPALVACLPDEEHEVGALLAAIEVARLGLRPVYLGASVPLADLERALGTLQPDVTLLSAVRDGPLEAHAPKLRELIGRWAARTALVVCGRGPALDALCAAGALAWPPERPLAQLGRALAERRGRRR